MAKYDDHDWDELPAEAKTAAGKLGYTKEKWDGDAKSSFDDYDWAELEADVKEAAGVLGYDQKSWDA